jgi:hypothetical protein
MSETPWKLAIECSDGRSLVVEAPDLVIIRDVMRELAKAPDSHPVILPPQLWTTAVFGDCFKVKVDGETVADGYDATLAPGWKSGPSLRAQREALCLQDVIICDRDNMDVVVNQHHRGYVDLVGKQTMPQSEFSPRPFPEKL